MKISFLTKESRVNFAIKAILVLLSIYIGYLIYLSNVTDPATFGFGMVSIVIIAPLQLLLLALFVYFFQRGYLGALGLLGWVIVDLLALIIGSEVSPSLLVLNMIL